MKKLLGIIGSYFFFYIGHISSLVGYIKFRDKYIMDEYVPEFIEDFIFNLYIASMSRSFKIQLWSGNEKPWK